MARRSEHQGSGARLIGLWVSLFALLSPIIAASSDATLPHVLVSLTPVCPSDTLIRPGRYANLIHGFDNSSAETLYVCLHIRGERWPPMTEVLDYSPVFPGTSLRLLGHIVVPDTAAAGQNVITWMLGCAPPFGPTCSYTVTIPPLVGAGRALARAATVQLAWSVADSSADTATVYRREQDGSWIAQRVVSATVGSDLQYLDRTAVPGTNYEYRLGLPVEDRQIYRGEVLAGVPDLVSAGSALVEPGRIALQWSVVDSAAQTVGVSRRIASGPWSMIATTSADGAGILRYIDYDVAPGQSYAYRIVVTLNDTTFVRGEVTAVAAIPSSVFEVALAGGNPVCGVARVAVTKGRNAGATLELLDAAGRSVSNQRLPPASGRYVVNVPESGTLPPGVYFLQVAVADQRRHLRVVVVR